ncbi:MAG: YkgJ family cysteine cluster protein, partial [Promethearchaeota archaeon]
FLNDDYTCAIYEARPIQCKTYPFWTSIFKDRGSLNYEKLHCPGFGHGKFYTKEEIEEKLYDIGK